MLIAYSTFLTTIVTAEISLTINYISSQIISYIPQQTTEDKGETDQMDSFSESDLQLADEIATAEIQFDTFTDEEIEIMVKTIPS